MFRLPSGAGSPSSGRPQGPQPHIHTAPAPTRSIRLSRALTTGGHKGPNPASTPLPPLRELSGSALGLAVSQASFSCPDDGLCSIGHLQLAEDVGDVVAHRLE